MTKSNVQVNSNEVVVSSTVTVNITELLSSIPLETLGKAIESRLGENELVVIGKGDELNDYHKQYLRNLLGEADEWDMVADDDEDDEEMTEEEIVIDDEDDDYYEEDDDEEVTAEQLLQAITKFLSKQ